MGKDTPIWCSYIDRSLHRFSCLLNITEFKVCHKIKLLYVNLSFLDSSQKQKNVLTNKSICGICLKRNVSVLFVIYSAN